MSARDTQILFVGDMHLGRLPARVPASDSLPQLAELGPGAAWRRTAHEAVRLGVDAVALAGDVVHGAGDTFEGASELGTGLAILARAGIPVLAVAGNHDTRVLPDLAHHGGITLLGPEGTWTFADIAPDGKPAVRLVGWSFPRPHWPESPLAAAPPPPPPGVVTLGLLHADLDVPGSPYAPVTGAELAATGYAGWLLGHVHTPGLPSGAGRPFYLGSLCGLDPTETDVHGPVLASVGDDGQLSLRRLPLAPLRWLSVDLDLGAAKEPVADLEPLTFDAVARACAASCGPDDATLAFGIRLALHGAVDDPAAVRAAAEALAEKSATMPAAGAIAFLEKVSVGTHQRVDLRQVAQGDDPPGLIARRILALEGADDVPGIADAAAWRAQLMAEARRAVTDVDQLAHYRCLDEPVGDDEIRREALATAWALYERLDRSRKGASCG